MLMFQTEQPQYKIIFIHKNKQCHALVRADSNEQALADFKEAFDDYDKIISCEKKCGCKNCKE